MMLRDLEQDGIQLFMERSVLAETKIITGY